MSIPIRIPVGGSKAAPQREEKEKKEEAPRRGPSRHSTSSHASGGGSGWDTGGEWDSGGTWEDEPEQAAEEQGAKLADREGLEQDLAALLSGGKREDPQLQRILAEYGRRRGR